MVARVFSAGLSGIDGYIVTVECLPSNGLPRLDVVGLPTGAVAEAGERVRAAVKSCSFDWPVSRITVNLAPADTRKAGTAYDLPILLSILAATGQIEPLPQDAIFLGELSLSGLLRPVCGALSMALAARDAGFRTVYVPTQNAQEASYATGITILPVDSLPALIAHLSGRAPLAPCPPPEPPPPEDNTLDFSHVMGQNAVKRALEIAAAGGHNICTMCYIIMALENQYLYDFLRFHSLYTHLFSEYFLLNIPKSILFFKEKRKADLTQPSFLFCLFQSLFYFCDL